MGGRHLGALLWSCVVMLGGCADELASRDAQREPLADTRPDALPDSRSETDAAADTAGGADSGEPPHEVADLSPDTRAETDTDDTGPADTASTGVDLTDTTDDAGRDTAEDLVDEPGPDGGAPDSSDTSDSADVPDTHDISDTHDTPDIRDTDDTHDVSDSSAALDTSDTSDSSELSDADDTGDAAPTCSPCATGRIRFERRRPNPALSALGPHELAPLTHHPVGLVGTTSHTRTDANGFFTLPLPPGASCHLTFAALLPRDPSSPFTEPSLAVLSTDLTSLPNLGSPAFQAERLWAWSSNCHPDVPLDLVIRVADGSGALAAFDTARTVLTALTEHFGPTDLDLALVWQRGRAWSCGSCNLDARFSGVTHTASGHHFPRAIFLSGTNADPHQFTPSIIAHELGHFALELWSSPPLIGGAHGFDRRVDPILAWSEGAATVIGQWSLIGSSPIPRRFFAVQQNVQYWVDLEAIGRSPAGDDSNLSFFVPMPRPLDPLDQPLSEGVVAAILWDLLDTNTEHPGEVVALGPLLMSLLSDPRLADVRAGGPDRAATGPDLVDLLDALRCDPTLHALVGPPSTLPAPLTALLLDFPYDDLPLCESNPP